MTQPPERPLPTRQARREYRLLTEREPLRPALLLTALGTVIPGGGLALGRKFRVLGYVMLIGMIALVIAASYLLLTRSDLKSLALDLGSRDTLVMQVFWVGLVAALIWIGSVILTAVSSRPKKLDAPRTAALAAFTALMCALLAFPSYYVLARVRAHQEVLATSFVGKSTEQRAEDEKKGVVTPKDAPDPWEGTDRVNVLLLGSDTRHEGDGVRTDSMMVASVNTQTGETVLIGIPRNLQNVPFPKDSPLHKYWPKGYNCGDECLMNAVWTEATNRAAADPDAFKGDSNPGLSATQDAIGEVLGLRIDNTLIIDFEGFTALVDALDGVKINVRTPIPIGDAYVGSDGQVHADKWLQPGVQKLTGYQALWYSRSRKADSDYGRMRRQRCMVGALLKQTDTGTVMNRYTALAGVLKENVVFDIEPSQLPAWVTLLERMQSSDMKVLTFTSDVIRPARPDYDKIRGLVQQAITTGDPEGAVASAKGSQTTAPGATKTPSTKTPATTPAATTMPSADAAPTTGAGETPTGSATVDPDADVGGDIFDAC